MPVAACLAGDFEGQSGFYAMLDGEGQEWAGRGWRGLGVTGQTASDSGPGSLDGWGKRILALFREVDHGYNATGPADYFELFSLGWNFRCASFNSVMVTRR